MDLFLHRDGRVLKPETAASMIVSHTHLAGAVGPRLGDQAGEFRQELLGVHVRPLRRERNGGVGRSGEGRGLRAADYAAADGVEDAAADSGFGTGRRSFYSSWSASMGFSREARRAGRRVAARATIARATAAVRKVPGS